MIANRPAFFILVRVFSMMCLFVSCGKHDSYGVDPDGIVTNYTQYGPGTSNDLGALTINIHSTTANKNYEHYMIDIDGMGSRSLPINTIQINETNKNPGTYPFQLDVICDNGNDDNCRQRFLKGKFTVKASYTTVLDIWL